LIDRRLMAEGHLYRVITIERRGFENGTAFSAVAPSWRLVGLGLSIVCCPITTKGQHGF
jgi:hypothetical protein